MMTNRSLVLLASLAAAAVVAADPGALDGVMAADAAFAALSVERGYQVAFQENLAPDGVLFRPAAVNGRDWLATNEPSSGRLEWTPTAGAVACTGKLAVTTGRWTYANAESGDAAAGHYLSVWRHESDGRWRIALDHGIDHPAQAAPAVALPAAFAAFWPAAGKYCQPSRGEESLANAERALNDAIGTKGLASAMQRSATNGAVAYRDDAAPGPIGTVGAETDRRFDEGSVATSQFVSAEPGSNMGYSYGEIAARAEGAAPAARAVYVRIWQRDGRHWRVAIDVTTMLSPAET